MLYILDLGQLDFGLNQAYIVLVNGISFTSQNLSMYNIYLYIDRFSQMVVPPSSQVTKLRYKRPVFGYSHMRKPLCVYIYICMHVCMDVWMYGCM